jgi:prepilin-type N-terminal cleavage/methylation domain-containing protein
MNRVDPRADGGFTLVEVMMALLILAIVSLGIAGMFSHSIVVNASGYDYARLSSQARFVLEELRARPFDDVTLDETPVGAPRTWLPAGGATYSNRGFAASYSVTDFTINSWGEAGGVWPLPTGTRPANVKRITVTVTSSAQNLQGNRVLTVSALKVAG